MEHPMVRVFWRGGWDWERSWRSSSVSWRVAGWATRTRGVQRRWRRHRDLPLPRRRCDSGRSGSVTNCETRRLQAQVKYQASTIGPHLRL